MDTGTPRDLPDLDEVVAALDEQLRSRRKHGRSDARTPAAGSLPPLDLVVVGHV